MNYTTPAMDKVTKAFSKSIVEAFEKGALVDVYRRASALAPKIYPPTEKPSDASLDKVTDLLADAFLILKDVGR